MVFYCKTYCLLNMFRAPLCPSPGALELYRWLLPVLFGSLVYRSLALCGTVGYVSSLRDTARLKFPANWTHNPQHHSDGCCLWYLVLWFTGRWSDVELWVMWPVCGILLDWSFSQTGHITHSTIEMAAACGIWFFGLQVVGLMWSCGLCVQFAGYC